MTAIEYVKQQIIPLEVRIQYLKDLPKGSIVRYVRLHSSIGYSFVKMSDCGNVMKVLTDDGIMAISYRKLTCDAIDDVIKVTIKLTGKRN